MGPRVASAVSRPSGDRLDQRRAPGACTGRLLPRRRCVFGASALIGPPLRTAVVFGPCAGRGTGERLFFRSSASVRAGAPAAPRFASPASRRRFADFRFDSSRGLRGLAAASAAESCAVSLGRSVNRRAYRTRKLMGISFGSPGRRSIGAGREEVASTWRVETRRAHSHMSPSAMRLDTPQRCVRPERRRPSMPVKAPRSLSRPRHGTAVCARFRPLSPVQPPGASLRPASSTARMGNAVLLVA